MFSKIISGIASAGIYVFESILACFLICFCLACGLAGVLAGSHVLITAIQFWLGGP